MRRGGARCKGAEEWRCKVLLGTDQSKEHIRMKKQMDRIKVYSSQYVSPYQLITCLYLITCSSDRLFT